MQAELRESEATLAEMGGRLSDVQLEKASLQEEEEGRRRRMGGGDYATWQEDAAVSECQQCGRDFGLARRKVTVSLTRMMLI